jgi:hypothetical protein
MTTSPDAFDIASRFLDSGKDRNDLELLILQHMERHVAAEREACAKLIADRFSDVHGISAIADAIRERNQR